MQKKRSTRGAFLLSVYICRTKWQIFSNWFCEWMLVRANSHGFIHGFLTILLSSQRFTSAYVAYWTASPLRRSSTSSMKSFNHKLTVWRLKSLLIVRCQKRVFPSRTSLPWFWFCLQLRISWVYENELPGSALLHFPVWQSIQSYLNYHRICKLQENSFYPASAGDAHSATNFKAISYTFETKSLNWEILVSGVISETRLYNCLS